MADLAKRLLSLNIDNDTDVDSFLADLEKMRSGSYLIDIFIFQHPEMALKIVQISDKPILGNTFPICYVMKPVCPRGTKISMLAKAHLNIFKYLLESLNTSGSTKLDDRKEWLVTSVEHWDKLSEDEHEQIRVYLTGEWLLSLTGYYHGSYEHFRYTFSGILPLVSDDAAEYFFSHVYVELDGNKSYEQDGKRLTREQASNNLNKSFITTLTQRFGNEAISRIIQAREKDPRLTSIDNTSGLSTSLIDYLKENSDALSNIFVK